VILSGRESLKVNFYFETVDSMIAALDLRFSDKVLPLLKSLGCLNNPENTNVDALRTLAGYFEKDLNVEELLQEYRLFCRVHANTTSTTSQYQHSGIHTIYKAMVKNQQVTIYPNLSKLYQLALTLPVSSASCERSFSALKIIKNRLRTVMTQDRLRDLLIISVNSHRMRNPALDEMVSHFWKEFSSERR
jgi:hypothetical protein